MHPWAKALEQWFGRMFGAEASAHARRELPLLPVQGQDIPVAVWRQRLEHAGMLGLLAEFEVAPVDVATLVAVDQRSLLDGPELFGRRLVRWHPWTLLYFVRQGWWVPSDLGRFVDQTCHFGAGFFAAGGGAWRDAVLPDTVRSWCSGVLGHFELSLEQRCRFVGHVATGIPEELWLEHGYPCCAPHVAGLEMDVLLAVAGQVRPDAVALEIHPSLDAGLRNVQYPSIDLHGPNAHEQASRAPFCGICPELDLMLEAAPMPVLHEHLYYIGVHLKRLQLAGVDSLPLPELSFFGPTP